MERARCLPLEDRAAARHGRAAEGSGLVREMVRKGDYLVPKRSLAAAEDAYEERSERSRRVDSRLRAPITTDLEFWQDHQRGYDYPGVDTPSDEPRQAITDHPGLRGRARMAKREQNNARLSRQPRSKSVWEDLDDLTNRPLQIPSLADLIPGSFR